jgi:hypothetical protein
MKTINGTIHGRTIELAEDAGLDDGQEVRVQVTPLPGAEPSPDEWRRQVLETAGKWQGPLERPEQGKLETREPLP